MSNRVGQQLSNYRLIQYLGGGGFADVYLGEHIHLGTQVAIKVLHARFSEDEVEHFRQEARTVAHLTHPHIVRIFDFGIESKMPFLVMDYVPHGTVRQHHPRKMPLPLATIVSYCKQIASALQYAHDQKLIHRDVKPENILLGRDNKVLLSDFGLVIIAQSTGSISMKEVVGTAPYMAPEQLQGKPRPASDQYALGVVVYEWLSGKRPFNGTFLEIASQHLLIPPPPLHGEIPGISLALEEVVFTALAKEPQQRFASVQDFATAFEEMCQRVYSGLFLQPSVISLPHQSSHSMSIIPFSESSPLTWSSSAASILIDAAAAVLPVRSPSEMTNADFIEDHLASLPVLPQASGKEVMTVEEQEDLSVPLQPSVISLPSQSSHSTSIIPFSESSPLTWSSSAASILIDAAAAVLPVRSPSEMTNADFIEDHLASLPVLPQASGKEVMTVEEQEDLSVPLPQSLLFRHRPRHLWLVACVILMVCVFILTGVLSFAQPSSKGSLTPTATTTVITTTAAIVAPTATTDIKATAMARTTATATAYASTMAIASANATATAEAQVTSTANTLTIQITNIPARVAGGGCCVDVGVRTNEANVTVSLNVTYNYSYGNTNPQSAGPSTTDSSGNATISWLPYKVKTATAIVVAIAKDQYGQQTQSHPVTVTVVK